MESRTFTVDDLRPGVLISFSGEYAKLMLILGPTGRQYAPSPAPAEYYDVLVAGRVEHWNLRAYATYPTDSKLYRMLRLL